MDKVMRRGRFAQKKLILCLVGSGEKIVADDLTRPNAGQLTSGLPMPKGGKKTSRSFKLKFL